MSTPETGGSARDAIARALVLLLTPAVLLAVNPNLFITASTAAFVDPWVYLGYFLSLPRFLGEYAGTYYGTRLPWILPGYWAYQVFSPLVANYVVHLTFFYALLFGLYALISPAAGRNVALIAALLVAWNSAILGAMSWDYVDGAGIVFAVWTCLCLEKGAASKRPAVWLAGAGAFAVCVAGTNLFLGVLWPVFGLFFLLRRRERRLTALVRAGAAALAGALAMLGGLCVINHRLGGEWLFFEPQIRFSRALLSGPNQWAGRGYRRFLIAYELVIPVTACLGAAWACLRGGLRSRDADQRFAIAMQVVMLTMFAIFAGFELSGSPVLSHSFYISYLVPFAIVALALQATAAGCRLTTGQTLVVIVTAQLLLVAAHVLTLSGRRFLYFPAYSPENATLYLRVDTAAAVCVLLIGIVALRGPARPVLRWTVFVVCMSAAYALTPAVTFPWPDTSGARGRFASIVEAHRLIAADTSNGQRLRFWYDGHGANAAFLRGVSSTYLWGYRLLSEEWPALKPEEAIALRGQRLVLLLSHRSDLEPTLAVLKARGLGADEISTHEVGAGDAYMCVVTLTPTAAPPR